MTLSTGATFRQLHQKGNPFLLANVWDAGTAKIFAGLGAKALATSSAAHAFTLGRLDGTITRDEALKHAQSIVNATQLPVQGDFENGFGDSPETCAETVRLAAEVGLAGICIEDTALPHSSPYDFKLSVERIRAAAEAARELEQDFVLTARADGVLTGHYDPQEALRRLLAFEAAGADCLYAPMARPFHELAHICSQTTKPVNILLLGESKRKTLPDFASIGAARLSLGSSLASVIQQRFSEVSKECLDGHFESLSGGIDSNLLHSWLKE